MPIGYNRPTLERTLQLRQSQLSTLALLCLAWNPWRRRQWPMASYEWLPYWCRSWHCLARNPVSNPGCRFPRCLGHLILTIFLNCNSCSTAAGGSPGQVVSGTAVSTSGRTEWQVVAHEIGHNFGAIVSLTFCWTDGRVLIYLFLCRLA
jgi:hypothetical protein